MAGWYLSSLLRGQSYYFIASLDVRGGARLVARAVSATSRARAPLPPQSRDLAHVRELVAGGALRPTIDTTWPLHRAAEAHAHVESHRVRGKDVIVVREE